MSCAYRIPVCRSTDCPPETHVAILCDWEVSCAGVLLSSGLLFILMRRERNLSGWTILHDHRQWSSAVFTP